MAWIESHQSVWEHAKTRKAARRLGIPTVQVVGHLQSLWHWAIDHAEDGNLSKYDADDLAIAARWDGDPDEFVAALVECGPGGTAGFLERGGLYGPPEDEVTGDLVIHDWWEYAGKLVARRQRDRMRKRAARSDSPPEDVRGTSSGQDVDGPPDAASRGTNQPTNREPTEVPTEPDGSGGKPPRTTSVPEFDEELPVSPGWGKPLYLLLRTWAVEAGFERPPDRKPGVQWQWLMQVVDEVLGDGKHSHGVRVSLCGEFVGHVTGEPPSDEAWGHLRRLVSAHTGSLTLAALGQACDWGAGLRPQDRGDPLSLTKYAAAILQRWEEAA